MYRKPESQMRLELEDPFRGELDPENRWIQWARSIPWDDLERRSAYGSHFSQGGPAALDFRTALAALLIQRELGASDSETVQQIRENPYLQYFLGLKRFRAEPPFHPSQMGRFRRRLEGKLLASVPPFAGGPVKLSRKLSSYQEGSVMTERRETYDEYLASMGLTKGSDEEIALLQKVFDVEFFEDGEEDEHEHHEGCTCGCHDHDSGEEPENLDDFDDGEELEEMSDEEVMEAVKAYLAEHPEDCPGR